MMWYIYTMDYFSAAYKNEIMPSVATWMQLKVIVTKGDRSERGRQTPPRNHLHVESKI